MEEETKSKWKKAGDVAGTVIVVGWHLIGAVICGIAGVQHAPPDPPKKDPDEELEREGYEKVGKNVWYDRDGKRREKDIWRKKKY